MEQLLAHGAAVGVNELDARGFSPLHHAVRSGKPQVVRALLLAGADSKLPTALGLTARQLAATRAPFADFPW